MKHTNQIGNLPRHKAGSNKGRLDRVRAAKELGISDNELHKAYNNWVQLFRRPGCTLTLEQYFLKMREVGITPDDLGNKLDDYNLARRNDEGPYTNESCGFIRCRANHKEQKKVNPFQRVVDKHGHEVASRQNSINAVKGWANRKANNLPMAKRTAAHRINASIAAKAAWARKRKEHER